MKCGKLKYKEITDSKFLVNVGFKHDKAHDNYHADGCSVVILHLAVCRLLINSHVYRCYILLAATENDL
jgi:hypothetical protein